MRRPDRSPSDTVRLFVAHRTGRDYAAVEPLVVTEQSLAVSTFLQGVDRFLDANRRLCETTRDCVAVGVAESVDQSYLADALGLLGTGIEVLDERIEGEAASVSYTARGRLPPERVTLRRVGNTWRIDPGAGFSPLMNEAFAAMADGLERLTHQIETGQLPATTLLADAERLPREVERAMQRGVDLLSKARSQAAGGGP